MPRTKSPEESGLALALPPELPEHMAPPKDHPSSYDLSYVHLAFAACRMMGATNLDLAEMFRTNPQTIINWRHWYPDFNKAVVRGRDIFDSKVVEGSLKKSATGYDYEEVKIEEITITQKQGDEIIRVPAKRITTTTKHQPPNPVSCKFYLINRHAERWTDRSELQLKADLDVDIKITEEMTEEEASTIYADMIANSHLARRN